MKFFIGAKNLTGQVIVAEMVEADDFLAASNMLIKRAEAEAGQFNYRLTAVNEYVEVGSVNVHGTVAEFLEGARA